MKAKTDGQLEHAASREQRERQEEGDGSNVRHLANNRANFGKFDASLSIPKVPSADGTKCK